MKKLSLALVFVSVNIFWTVTARQCKEKFVAQSYVDMTVCNNITERLPPLENYRKSFYCEHCGLKVLASDTTLQQFTGVTFDMRDGSLTDIKTGAFENFSTSVNTFIFSGNKLERIDAGLFVKFNALAKLNFSNNCLDNLQQDVFNGVRTEKLDMSNNGLENLDLIFRGLSVSSLNLTSNNLVALTNASFAGVNMTSRYSTFQRYIDISYNRISSIEPGTFSAMKNNLYALHLGNNQLKIINESTFDNMGIQLLHLNDNEIDTVDVKAFANLARLRDLDLSNNRLRNVSVELLAPLRLLRRLALDSNYISHLGPTVFSGLSELRTLTLSHNFLTTFNPELLVPLRYLAEFDVSSNRLAELDLKRILEHNSGIRSISLHNNFWECSHLFAMFKLLVKNSSGLNVSGEHEVPNLHGIACSMRPVVVTDDFTFEQFLTDIADDRDMEDLYRVHAKLDEDASAQDSSAIYAVALYRLLVLCAVIYVVSVLVRVSRHLLFRLQNANGPFDNFALLRVNNSNDE